MKKLMIAAAVMMFGIAAHAAAYTWSGEVNNYDWGSDQAGTGTLEFFINGVAASPAGGTFDNDGSVFFEYTINAGDQLKVISTITNFSDGAGYREWEFDFSQTYIDSKPGADEALKQMTQALNLDVNNGSGLDYSGTIAANGYTAVPEPTSGLLLLLGVAGLALRRRRA